MKRVLSLVLALALVLGSIPAGFAADTQTAGEILKGYGVLSGDANGNLNETQTIDRATMYTVLIKLLGKDAEAKAYTVPSTFTDDDTNWAANYIAFAEKEGLTKGIGNGLFSPNGKVTLQQMATIMLRALGYEADYNTAIADATAQGLLKGVVETENAGIVVKSDVYSSMLNTLNAPVKGSTELLGNVLKIAGFNVGAELKVASITASTAKSFAVKFNRAVAETDKVTFAVKRGTTAMTVTTTWNADKTEATLTSSANLPAATYTVSVLADAKEVSNKEIAITAQKLAKIEIVSDKLSVVSGVATFGYATYKAFDQYNNDVTASYLTNNITWQTGVGTLDGTTTKGVLKLTPTAGTNLLVYSTVVITGLDTTAGVTVTKSLATTTALGTLSDFKFGDASNVKLVDGDTTSVFYIPYTATDMSGNETKNYDLVRQGLLDTVALTATTTDLTVSNNNITAKVVKDPANSKNAAIEVKVTAAAANIIDLPVTITAMTLTGKVSSINTTLAKAKQLDTFTLMAPASNIASNEKVEIPFEAYDQAGNKITKYSDINGKITLTPAGNSTVTDGLYLVEKVDGSAKLMFNAPTVVGTQSQSTYVTAVVSASTTGKMSSLNLTTQEAVKPTEISFDASSLVTAMEHGAVQGFDFGTNEDNTITVLDQYGRDADFYHTAFPTYAVRLKVTGDLTIGGTDLATYAGYATLDANTGDMASVTANAAAGGSGTLTIELYDVTNALVVDSQTVALSVVKTTDIVDYTMNAVTKTAYTTAANGTAYGALTAQQKDYALTLKVFGKTTGGSKVFLAGTPVMSASVDNNNDFIAYTASTTANAYDAAKVIALKPADVAKTSSTTKATVSIFHNAKVTNVSSTINSSTALPTAVTPKVVVSDYAGVRVDGDNVYFDISATPLTTSLVQRYAANGSTTGRNADFFFSITDSYGETGMFFANFKVVAQTGTSNVSIDAAGNLTVTAFNLNDTVTISAITNNGLVKTVKIIAE